ncbi:MAG: esterase [Myxococcales bacterium]|nr:esterase [Myxococcales bacterium]
MASLNAPTVGWRRFVAGCACAAALSSVGCREDQAPVTKHPQPSAEATEASASVVRTAASHAAPSAAQARQQAEPSASPSSDLTPKKSVAADEKTWVWKETPIGEMQVVVSVPKHFEGQKLPVLITMHGLGEARKGPEKGARGWLDDYDLAKAEARLHSPPLTTKDLHGFAGERLDVFNQALKDEPYRGLIVVMPYTPDILKGDRPFSLAEPLASFLVDKLLPRVYEETPAIGSVASTGIDGVSLGGRAALLVGLLRPEAFGAVGGLQPAFDQKDAPELTRRALAARKKNPKFQLRLLTSVGDFFLGSTKAISQAFDEADVFHSLVIVPGDHSYRFNRGPGAYELLMYHDRVLRGRPPV